MIFSESTVNSQSKQAYLLLRLGLGLCFAIHGSLRFSQAAYFDDLLQLNLGESLYAFVLFTYTYLIPAVELLGGLLLCLGFMKRWAISSLTTIMLIWILSSIIMEYWNNMASQLLFFFILYWLYFKIDDDQISFDHFLKL